MHEYFFTCALHPFPKITFTTHAIYHLPNTVFLKANFKSFNKKSNSKFYTQLIFFLIKKKNMKFFTCATISAFLYRNSIAIR